jgi:hypothetical protein
VRHELACYIARLTLFTYQAHQNLVPSLTSTVRLTTIARSELSLAASLSRSCVPVSTKAFDFPVFVGAVQAARAEREARFLLWTPDLEAEEASLLAELLRVVTSARVVSLWSNRRRIRNAESGVSYVLGKHRGRYLQARYP